MERTFPMRCLPIPLHVGIHRKAIFAFGIFRSLCSKEDLSAFLLDMTPRLFVASFLRVAMHLNKEVSQTMKANKDRHPFLPNAATQMESLLIEISFPGPLLLC